MIDAIKEDAEKALRLSDFTIERAVNAIFWINSEARIYRVNQAACRMYGYTRNELLSMTVYDINPDYQKEKYIRFWKTTDKYKPLTLDTYHHAKGGRIFPVEVTVNYIEFEGEVYHCNFVRDMTERKHVSEEIKKMAKFPDENPNPVLRISKEGAIIYSNKVSDILLREWQCGEKKSLSGEWRELAASAFKTGKSREAEAACSGKVFSLTFAPVTGSNYLNVYALDITNRKQAEDALQKALVEVQQLKSRLLAENIYLQEEIKVEHNFEEIVTQSEAFKKVLAKVEQVASTDATVLITGETGTGKELLARAVHNISVRRDRPLVKVNCAALPANLIESELFGHDKGAFTGALNRKIGRFKIADGGTIFLDEIGDLPFHLQAKLLRVLQEGEFEQLGDARTQKVNVRVIAATNRDLKKQVENENFRQDLYYRLNVFPVHAIPLRDRKEDIPLLLRHFVNKYGAKLGKKIDAIPQKVMQSFEAYSWPGNVRELENVVERAVIISPNKTLYIDEPFNLDPGESLHTVYQAEKLCDIERHHILDVLKSCHWVIDGKRGAAKRLGVPPSTLRDRMRKYNIIKPVIEVD